MEKWESGPLFDPRFLPLRPSRDPDHVTHVLSPATAADRFNTGGQPTETWRVVRCDLTVQRDTFTREGSNTEVSKKHVFHHFYSLSFLPHRLGKGRMPTWLHSGCMAAFSSRVPCAPHIDWGSGLGGLSLRAVIGSQYTNWSCLR